MSTAEKLREALQLHAAAITPVDRLATYLLLWSATREIGKSPARRFAS